MNYKYFRIGSYFSVILYIKNMNFSDTVEILGRVIPKTFKMVLDAALLNIQLCKVWIKGKVEESRERSSALSFTSV